MTSPIEIKLKTQLKMNRFKYKVGMRRTKDKIVVETDAGFVQGVKRLSLWKDEFFSFEGIPFAKPPVGKLRFRDPQPPEPWKGLRDCTGEGNVPIQWNKLYDCVEGSEDCLYLSVYTTNVHPHQLLPVMVWIYGGNFENGSTNKAIYAPDYFMSKDIVLVVIAYRLSVFGFLSLKEPMFCIPGNAGLRDQIMALKWVRINISAFGGNPCNVTAFGHDAGAASVNFLMMSDQAKGLFHKAILLSGSAMCYWAHQPLGNDWVERLVRLMGYKHEYMECRALNFLQYATAKDILSKVSKILNTSEQRSKMFTPTGPVIEPYVGMNCVIPKCPAEMTENAWGNSIPVIIGGNSLEALVFYPTIMRNPEELEQLSSCEHLVPLDLKLETKSQQIKDRGEQIRRTYFKTKPKLYNYLKLLSHKIYWQGIRNFYLTRLKYSKAPTYLYRFNYDSPTFNHHRVLNCGKAVRGVSHYDILSYLFYNAFAQDLTEKMQEYQIVKILIATFTHFAETCNPNNCELAPVFWKPGSTKPSARVTCLDISTRIAIINLPEDCYLDMWDRMYTEKKNT